MRIAITGATGFVGINLVKKLLEINTFEIAVLTRNQEEAKKKITESEITFINTDQISMKVELVKFDPNIIIHLASYLTSKDNVKDISKLIDSNIIFGTQLLDCINEIDLDCFINVGTFAEYYYNDNEFYPAYLYSATKTAFRSILKYYQKKLNFKWINVIPYTIYGSNDSNKKVIDYLISSIDASEPIKMSNGEQNLDYIHIDDVVDFFVALLNKINSLSYEYVEFHLGTGIGTTIRELAGKIESVTGKKCNVNWGSLPYRPMDIMQAVAHTTKTKNLLDWKPGICIDEGLGEFIKKYE